MFHVRLQTQPSGKMVALCFTMFHRASLLKICGQFLVWGHKNRRDVAAERHSADALQPSNSADWYDDYIVHSQSMSTTGGLKPFEHIAWLSNGQMIPVKV